MWRTGKRFLWTVHVYPGTPAGFRVNSASVLTIIDDDSTTLSLTDAVAETLRIGEVNTDVQVASYTANEGTTLHVPWTLTHPMELLESSSRRVIIDVQNELTTTGYTFSKKPELPNYETSGTFDIEIGNVDANETVYLEVRRSFVQDDRVLITENSSSRWR